MIHPDNSIFILFVPHTIICQWAEAIPSSLSRYTLSSSLCFAFFLPPFSSVDSSASNPTYCNRDVYFLPLFGFLLSFLLLLYTIQLITEVYTFFSVFPFLSLHNSTCNRGILYSSLWISVFFSLYNSTWGLLNRNTSCLELLGLNWISFITIKCVLSFHS
ncbi:unnamed protein product [Acanthosepion pharaonis]|uniref:Uncharacterized protein n=1 Tax=Acanthosepion pharaonis TaxID=158019 RepID=A0A812D6H6_ACAPH|nr:unnamed protein product [Sepia pharaonis]